MSWKEDLYEIVRSVPSGSVVSYGAVGRALLPPLSGLLVGRALRNCPMDVPWWRVVGSDGRLPIAKQSVDLEYEQLRRLEAEGVSLKPDGRVNLDAHKYLFG